MTESPHRPEYLLTDYFELGPDDALSEQRLVDENRQNPLPVRDTCFSDHVAGYLPNEAHPYANVSFVPKCTFSETQWDIVRSIPRQVFTNGVRVFTAANRPRDVPFHFCLEKTQHYVSCILTTVPMSPEMLRSFKAFAKDQYVPEEIYYYQKAAGVSMKHASFHFAEVLLKEVLKDRAFFNLRGERVEKDEKGQSVYIREDNKITPAQLLRILDMKLPEPGCLTPKLMYGSAFLPRLELATILGMPKLEMNTKDVFFGLKADFLINVFLNFLGGSMCILVSDTERHLTFFAHAMCQMCYPFQPKCQRRFATDADLGLIKGHNSASFFLMSRAVWNKLPKKILQLSTTVFDIDHGELLVQGKTFSTVNDVPFPPKIVKILVEDFRQTEKMFFDAADSRTMNLYMQTIGLRFVSFLFRLHREFLINRSFVDFSAELNQDGYLACIPKEEADCMRNLIKTVPVSHALRGGRPFPLGDALDHAIVRQIWNLPLDLAVQQVMLTDSFLSSKMGDFSHFRDYERNVVKLSDIWRVGLSTVDVVKMEPRVVNVIEIDMNPVYMTQEENARIFAGHNFHIRYPIRKVDDYCIEDVPTSFTTRCTLCARVTVQKILQFKNFDLVPYFSLMRQHRAFRFAFLKEMMIALKQLPVPYRVSQNSFMLFKQLVNDILGFSVQIMDLACILRILEIMDRTHYRIGSSTIFMHVESILKDVIPSVFHWLTFYNASLYDKYSNSDSNKPGTLQTILSLQEYEQGANAETTVNFRTYAEFMRYLYDFGMQADDFGAIYTDMTSSKALSLEEKRQLRQVFENKKEYTDRDARQSPQNKYVVVILDDKCHMRRYIKDQIEPIINKLDVHSEKGKAYNDVAFLLMSSSNELAHWFGRHAPFLDPRKQNIRFITNRYRPLDGGDRAPVVAMEIIHAQKGYEKASVLVFCGNSQAAAHYMANHSAEQHVHHYYITEDLEEVTHYIKDGSLKKTVM